MFDGFDYSVGQLHLPFVQRECGARFVWKRRLEKVRYLGSMEWSVRRLGDLENCCCRIPIPKLVGIKGAAALFGNALKSHVVASEQVRRQRCPRLFRI